MNIENYKATWLQQVVQEKPSSDFIIHETKRVSTTNKLNLIVGLLSIGLAGVFIAGLFIYIPMTSMYTKCGLGILILAALLVILYSRNLLNRWFKTPNSTATTKEYLHQLTQIKTIQTKYQSVTISIFLILLMLGIGLTTFEYILLIKTSYAVIYYAFMVLWFGFNWFYLRPKVIARQQLELDNLTSVLENIDVD